MLTQLPSGCKCSGCTSLLPASLTKTLERLSPSQCVEPVWQVFMNWKRQYLHDGLKSHFSTPELFSVDKSFLIFFVEYNFYWDFYFLYEYLNLKHMFTSSTSDATYSMKLATIYWMFLVTSISVIARRGQLCSYSDLHLIWPCIIGGILQLHRAHSPDLFHKA